MIIDVFVSFSAIRIDIYDLKYIHLQYYFDYVKKLTCDYFSSVKV